EDEVPLVERIVRPCELNRAAPVLLEELRAVGFRLNRRGVVFGWCDFRCAHHVSFLNRSGNRITIPHDEYRSTVESPALTCYAHSRAHSGSRCPARCSSRSPGQVRASGQRASAGNAHSKTATCPLGHLAL